MNKILYFTICLFFVFKANSLEIECKFEEVYSDSSIQQGLFLLKNQQLRYQYFDKNLYTILKKKDNFYLVQNSDFENFQKIPEDKTTLLNKITEIANDYPNINHYYQSDQILIKLEMNDDNFFKRIAIISDELSMSIFINDCENKKIEKRLFNFFPFYQYP